MAVKYISKLNGFMIKDKEARYRLSKLEEKSISVVTSEEEMDNVLSNATDATVGTYYKYVGATNLEKNYKNGAIYRVDARL